MTDHAGGNVNGIRTARGKLKGFSAMCISAGFEQSEWVIPAHRGASFEEEKRYEVMIFDSEADLRKP